MPVDEHVCRRLAEATRFGDVRHFATVDSTNRVVRDLAAAGAAEGVVAVADHQSAGRGRLDRTWESQAGAALLMTVLLRPAGLAPERLHLTTAAVAMAAAGACAELAGVDAELKWPNDLLVGDAKLAGVLAEAVGGAVAVGIGLNITAAPDGAVCLAGAGVAPTRDALLEATLVRLEAALTDGWDAVADTYRHTCATVGRRVRVDLHDRSVTGVAAAIDDGGRLVVDLGDSAVAVAAGDVVHLRNDPGDAAE